MQLVDTHLSRKMRFVSLLTAGTLVNAFLFAHSNATAPTRMGEGILNFFSRINASIHHLLEWRLSTFPDGFPHNGE